MALWRGGKGDAQEYRSHQHFRGTQLKEVVLVAVHLSYTYLKYFI